MKKNGVKMGQYILLLILLVLTIISIVPIILVVIASFTDTSALALEGFSFFPSKWSLDGWRYVGEMMDKIFRAYGITILVTFVGTFTTLIFDSMMAYSLSRPQFKLRGFLTMLLLISTLLSGGQLSSYIINTQAYHLMDKLIVLMIPSIGMVHIIMMRTYIVGTISIAVVESAKIDGARDYRIYGQIILPLMKPVTASVGFMTAVGYWNQWVPGKLYIRTAKNMPLQNVLMQVESSIQSFAQLDPSQVREFLMYAEEIPADSARMALLFTVLGPIMIAYPFFQKYFVKGLTMGSVKG